MHKVFFLQTYTSLYVKMRNTLPLERGMLQNMFQLMDHLPLCLHMLITYKIEDMLDTCIFVWNSYILLAKNTRLKYFMPN